jgi:hypothetical protein
MMMMMRRGTGGEEKTNNLRLFLPYKHERKRFSPVTNGMKHSLVFSFFPPPLVMSSLVERELFRAALFAHLLTNVADILAQCRSKVPIGSKEVSQLVLRYIFNKIPMRKDKSELGDDDDDPVFITTSSEAAAAQVARDLQHFGVSPSQLSAADLVQVIEYRFAKAATAMRRTKFKPDEAVVLETAASIPLLRYKGVTYTDHAQLGKRYPEHLHHVLALGIRYGYLQLANQGLACDYGRDYAADAAVEAFASAFNHFFDTYYSAFPDLEVAFGSRGSFFAAAAASAASAAADTHNTKPMLLMVNPPFDETVMSLAVEKVLSMLATRNESELQLRVRMILPAWKNLAALEHITASKFVTSRVLHKKGTFAFVNHMLPRATVTSPLKAIFPCDLWEVWLASSSSS